MKLLAGALLGLALLGPARAAEEAPSAPHDELVPLNHGYAFEQPQVLIRQRLFGLAHGLSLLAAACLDLPRHSLPIQEAYASWHAKQAKSIEVLVHDLARHYFGERADQAIWPDLARALGLPDSIQPALREISLEAACASLPQAIAGPRYDLARLLAETPPAGAAAASPDAVPPATEASPLGAPTSAGAAE